MKWKQITERTGCISMGNALVGCYFISPRELVLIDSGPVQSPRLLAFLAEKGWQARAVIHTHLHIDHIANNRLLESAFPDIKFYASPAEIKSMERYGKAAGGETEMPKWQADMIRMYSEQLQDITVVDGAVTIDGANFECIPLYGHSAGHSAVVTPDGVCCLGDAIVSEAVLAVSKLPYMLKVGPAMEAMAAIKTMDYPWYIIAHQSVEKGQDIARIASQNIIKEVELCRMAKEIIQKPMSLKRAVSIYMERLRINAREGWGMAVLQDTAAERFYYLVQTGQLIMDENQILSLV